MSEKFVVIGKSGFIGKNIRYYFENHSIPNATYLGRNDCNLLEEIKNEIGTIFKDANILIAAGIPRSKSNEKKDQVDNIKIIKNLISIFKKYQPKSIIFLSSVEVYGGKSLLPIDEDTLINTHQNLYAKGKILGENELLNYANNSKTPLCLLRLPGVYGSRGKYGLITKLIESIENEKKFTINGSGETLRDFVFVSDIARLFIELIKIKFEGQLILNFGSGNSLTLNEIYEKVCTIFGQCETHRNTKEASSSFDLIFNTQKLSKILPEFKLTSLEQGLTELYRLKNNH